MLDARGHYVLNVSRGRLFWSGGGVAFVETIAKKAYRKSYSVLNFLGPVGQEVQM